jgi:hypothetical protein
VSIIACSESDCEKPAYYKKRALCKAHHTKRWRSMQPAVTAKCAGCGSDYVKLGRIMYCSQECRVRSYRAQRKADRPSESEDTKECSRCETVKNRDDFGKDKRRVDGLFPYCRDCRRDYVGASRKKAAELSREEYSRRRWERISRDPVLRNEKALSMREGHLKRKYGMTLECYESMLARQNGCCKICGMRAEDEVQTDRGGYRRAFAVDHDHACCPGSISCGKCVRGLLCAMCNTGLGAFRDNQAVLTAAIQYLGADVLGAPLIASSEAA